ncbi:MAG: efflux RND transporter periplasmic adaptor subunit [Hyphomicrobium sp.]|jgi:RND family efflux transporter MFP subunit
MLVSSAVRSVALLLAVAWVLTGCGENASQGQSSPPPAPQVTVQKPETRSVADFDEYVGRFVAVDFVEIRARVSGYLDAVHFTDGQLVKAGDALFTIDRRPFQAALDQANASLAQARATLAYAESDLKRAEGLERGTVITQQVLEQRIQAKRVADAVVNARAAAVREAELDLQFTELNAPVSGRIGDRRVSPGNLVTGGTGGSTTLLATIASIDPIRLEFTMDEASYLRYVRATSETATDAANRGLTLTVRLKLIDEKNFEHEGQINFVDNAIDRSSGTIRARAEFSNPDGKLTPGMFGRVQVPTGPPQVALLVPEAAIGTEQVKKFVYTVGEDGIARQKEVTLGPIVDGMQVVASGISADDFVVVNGLMRVRPGAKVSPQQATVSPMASQAASHVN